MSFRQFPDQCRTFDYSKLAVKNQFKTGFRTDAATWLIAEIIQEMTSPPNRMSGILKVAAIPAAIQFYKSIGFEENPDGSREMILTREKALQFLEAYRLYWI